MSAEHTDIWQEYYAGLPVLENTRVSGVLPSTRQSQRERVNVPRKHEHRASSMSHVRAWSLFVVFLNTHQYIDDELDLPNVSSHPQQRPSPILYCFNHHTVLWLCTFPLPGLLVFFQLLWSEGLIWFCSALWSSFFGPLSILKFIRIATAVQCKL